MVTSTEFYEVDENEFMPKLDKVGLDLLPAPSTRNSR